MSQRLIRDDIKGGSFLNRAIKHSPTDYRKAACYYYGEPISFCIAFYDYGKITSPIGAGYQAELALAGNGFVFNRAFMKQTLAIFFENAKYNNIRLQALISPMNRQAVRLAEICGFSLEGRLRNVSPDGDRLIYSMLKEEYNGRYIIKAKKSTPAT